MEVDCEILTANVRRWEEGEITVPESFKLDLEEWAEVTQANQEDGDSLVNIRKMA